MLRFLNVVSLPRNKNLHSSKQVLICLGSIEGRKKHNSKRKTHFRILNIKNDKAWSLSIDKIFNQVLDPLKFCSSTPFGLVLPPMRLKKDMNPEALTCPST